MFITIEGPEGAGKTTVIEELKHKLSSVDVDVLFTREPGGIEISEKIRDIILDVSHTSLDGRTEALLYAAARRQHLVEKVMPALSEGKVVICDRFIDSSLAYQGFARVIGINNVKDINAFAIENCMPHLTLFLDIRPEEGIKRIASNKDREVNRLDKETMVFHELVYKGYQEVNRMYKDRVVQVDAEQKIEQVVEDCWSILEKELRKHGELDTSDLYPE